MELICEICTDEVKGKVVHARGKLRSNRKGETTVAVLYGEGAPRKRAAPPKMRSVDRSEALHKVKGKEVLARRKLRAEHYIKQQQLAALLFCKGETTVAVPTPVPAPRGKAIEPLNPRRRGTLPSSFFAPADWTASHSDAKAPPARNSSCVIGNHVLHENKNSNVEKPRWLTKEGREYYAMVHAQYQTTTPHDFHRARINAYIAGMYFENSCATLVANTSYVYRSGSAGASPC
jgi:hypothetical protein